MYKLRVYIFSNHVPCDASQKSNELKVWLNLGLSKKKKSQYVGLFLENHTKSNFSIRIPLYANLDFHKKMLFFQICSDGHMRVKRVPRASESSAVYVNQASLANWAWSERASRASEPGAVFANQANQAWSELAKRASSWGRKRGKGREHFKVL